MQTIGFVLLDNFALMSAASAIEPLRAANLLAEQPLYQPVFLAETAGPVKSSVGCIFETTAFTALPDDCNIVFVVAGGDPFRVSCKKTEQFLHALNAQGIKLGGISGGAVILARAGLMAGRRFTVHWEHYDLLRKLSAEFLMERRLYVIDRDRYSCAGGIAPLDMMHTLIAAEHGNSLARRVSDWFIHTGVRLANAPQRAGLAAKYPNHHPALSAAIECMENNIAEPLSLDQLAARVGIGKRQLQRLFQTSLSQTATCIYRDLRLEKADEMLQQTGLPIIEIALATGFPNPGHFARVYRDKFETTPQGRRKSTLRKEQN